MVNLIMKLYHYVHCPFCIRVRMGLGFLNHKFESVVVPYDDENTPIKLTGKKMLPIFVKNGGTPQNESLDILRDLDSKNQLSWEFYKANKINVDALIEKIGSPLHSLAMPYWIWTPEFNEKSRHYFQSKKEIKRGPFKNLVRDQKKYKEELEKVIEENLVGNLQPFYSNSKLTIVDIMIASHLWGAYVVPEFQFDPKIHQYLMKVKELTHFNYHEDFWQL